MLSYEILYSDDIGTPGARPVNMFVRASRHGAMMWSHQELAWTIAPALASRKSLDTEDQFQYVPYAEAVEIAPTLANDGSGRSVLPPAEQIVWLLQGGGDFATFPDPAKHDELYLQRARTELEEAVKDRDDPEPDEDDDDPAWDSMPSVIEGRAKRVETATKRLAGLEAAVSLRTAARSSVEPGTYPPFMAYYAVLGYHDDNGDDPEGMFRVLHTPTLTREEELHTDGTWQPTDFFASGAPRLKITEISPERAAEVLFGWRASGRIPFVEGNHFPALPPVSEPPPAPGSGPVDPATAQVIADAWTGGPNRAVVYEFDLGYIVYSSQPPRPAGDRSRPQVDRVGGRGVIDRATGELSVWPNVPPQQVAAMYRQAKSEG